MQIKLNALSSVKLWLVLFGLMPLSFVVITSFLSTSNTHLMTLPLTLTHYTKLFTPLIAQVVLRSILMASITTVACLMLAYPLSFYMVRSKYQSLLLVLMIIPFWTSSLIRTYALMALLKLHGLINGLLLACHLIDHPTSLLYSNSAVVIGLIYTLFPFMVLPLFTQMERFDFRLFDVARDLGANKRVLFLNVLLPNTLTGIVSGSLLVFLPAMTLFYIPNVLGGARSMLLGNLIQNQFFIDGNWPQGSATSLLLSSGLIVLIVLAKKIIERTS